MDRYLSLDHLTCKQSSSDTTSCFTGELASNTLDGMSTRSLEIFDIKYNLVAIRIISGRSDGRVRSLSQVSRRLQREEDPTKTRDGCSSIARPAGYQSRGDNDKDGVNCVIVSFSIRISVRTSVLRLIKTLSLASSTMQQMVINGRALTIGLTQTLQLARRTE